MLRTEFPRSLDDAYLGAEIELAKLKRSMFYAPALAQRRLHKDEEDVKTAHAAIHQALQGCYKAVVVRSLPLPSRATN